MKLNYSSQQLVKTTVIAGLAMAAFVGCTKKLDTDVKKSSYAIGQQIGNNLKQQNIEIDPDVLAMSLKDAAAGKPKMTPEEQQQALMKLQEAAVKKSQEQAEANKKEAVEFLEKNKTAEGVVTTKSGLQYKVIEEGKGKTPADTDFVSVHYTGTLKNGTKFDSSVDRGQPAEFPVNGVIPGWTEALKLMKVGAKYKLFIPPELAYGPSGRPGIPPNSVLIFDVELLDVKAEPPKPQGEKMEMPKPKAEKKK